ncbi:MAG TPA: type II and III secretion system protein family protein [Micropepsaceae bacterium]|jgi:pilus assembly protein CpaC|nr:type II and III secretion system protein family protein [Micropepsaceae bacterium]
MKHLNSFFRRTTAGVFVAAIVTAGASALAQETPSAPEESRIIHVAASANTAPQHISLALNKAAIIELDTDARDVFVANPLIADAVVRTPRRIFIMSLKIGQTNAIFLDAQGKQIAALEIAVGSDVTNLNDQLKHELPDTKVQAQSLNDNIVLSGSVNTVSEASRAQSMAERYAGSPDKVVNNLSIEQRQQVLIKVTVSEISRNISKQLGINLSSVVNAGGVPIVTSTDNQFSLVGRALSDLSGAQIGQVCQITNFRPRLVTDPSQPPVVQLPGEELNALGVLPGPSLNSPGTSFGFSSTNLCNAKPNNLQSTLKALERVGLVHTLAEPNLTAISGEAAKFLAGGEFPVPVSRDRDGNITVEFKQFGVGLSFTPVVLSKGRISLQISTEVSELTNTGAFTLGGSTTTDANGNTISQQGLTLPALAVRRAETTVELPSGGSLAIGGLIQQQTKQNLDALPGMKDLPILGALFRSRDFQNNESELVVSVSAYLVNPVSPTQIARPDDGYVVPTDLETMLLGRVNAVYGKDTKVPQAPKNAIGYIVQ